MKGNEAYVQELADALERKIARMESEGLPQLKEQFKIVFAAFQGLRNLMTKKGLIHDDPYRFDQRISEVSNPPEGSFTEAEKTDQVSMRISQFDGQLDFLINYYQFSFEFLTMDRVKRLLSLIRYFNFSQLSPNSTNINTRCFSEFTELIRKGSDALSVGVVNDGISHLDQSSRAITQILRELTVCHKESWKLSLRRDVMSLLAIQEEQAVSHQEDTVRLIKRKFAEIKPDRSFYPELVLEVVKEDFSQESEALRRAVLKDLAVKEEKKKEGKKEINFRTMLLEAVRLVSSVNLQLDDAVKKLEENSVILESELDTVWAKIRKALRAFFVRDAKEIFYEVDYTDPITTAQRSERINFNAFCEDIRRRAKLYAALNSKNGPSWQRMETLNEDQVYGFIEKNLEELQVVHRRLSALDLYFRSEVSKDARARLHGIKLEAETVRNTIIRANQKKHEYVSQKEEIEQMKRLGIKSDAI